MKSDDDSSKQEMKGQTEVKHDILEKYLAPWLLKITVVESEICYVDGFAGWGRYADGSPGSPLISMGVAKEILEDEYGGIRERLDTFSCDFVESNPSNFSDLKKGVEQFLTECPSAIEADCHNEKFEKFANSSLLNNESKASPTFIFIDPFGFSGVSFDTVRKLVNLRSTGIELFITFMSGKMAQFMETEEHEIAINDILGADDWKDRVPSHLSKDDRAERFVQIYEDQLRQEANVDYVWPFEMTEETKRQNCYYLIHATNHFDGFKIMKDIMFKAGADDQFAYLGPNHYPYIEEQSTLDSIGVDDNEEENIESLAEMLHEKFKGESMTFDQVLLETYEETPLIETHFRNACKQLRDQRRVTIKNAGSDSGGTNTGLDGKDLVKFKEGGLSKFLD